MSDYGPSAKIFEALAQMQLQKIKLVGSNQLLEVQVQYQWTLIQLLDNNIGKNSC